MLPHPLNSARDTFLERVRHGSTYFLEWCHIVHGIR
jgi:hypothetical protein